MAELVTCSFTGFTEQRGHALKGGWRMLVIEESLSLYDL
jgi:hypothetical protein